MSVGFNTALSGFNAASKRLEVASANIANQFSTRTVARDGTETVAPPPEFEVVQSSQELGGVRTEIRAKDTPPLRVFDPGHADADEAGLVSLPPTDTAQQLVNAKIASYDAQANLKTIRVQDNLFKSLLDIVT